MNTIPSFEDSGKVMGPADGVEEIPKDGWISVSATLNETIKDICIDNLKSMYIELLTRFPQFRLKLSLHNGFPHWKFAKNEEILFEDMVKTVKTYDDKISENYNLEEHPCWRFWILDENNKTRFRFSASHALVDGKSIFNFFELFVSLSRNQTFTQLFLDAEKEKFPLINSFEKEKLFNEEVNKNIHPPESWNKFIEINLYPLPELPSYSINTQWDFDYESISKFCRKYNVTCQSILMAIYSQALRNYHKGKIDNIIIGCYTAVNTRKTKFATDKHKKSVFFPGAGLLMVFIEKQKDILEDILHCKKKLTEGLNTVEPALSYIYQANLVDKNTFKYNFPKNFPITYKYNLFVSSNLGKSCVGMDNLTWRSTSPVDENGYWPNLYCFNNGVVFSIVLVHPYNIDNDFINSIIEQIKLFFDFIKNN